jgi:hypothetical protein
MTRFRPIILNYDMKLVICKLYLTTVKFSLHLRLFNPCKILTDLVLSLDFRRLLTRHNQALLAYFSQLIWNLNGADHSQYRSFSN